MKIAKTRLLKSLIGIVTLVAFSVTSFGDSIVQALEAPIALSSEYIERTNVTDIPRLSSNYADIKDFRPGTNGKTIFHIQDAHCVYSCQKTIANIVKELNVRYGVDIALLEGGSGEYDLSVFTKISDPSLREKVADYFVNEGRVNGIEYFAINNPDIFTLKGLEDRDLYIENLEEYVKNLPGRDKAILSLRYIKDKFRELKNKYYCADMMTLDSMKEKYLTKENQFEDYFNILITASDKYGIKLTDLKNAVLYRDLLLKGKSINFEKAAKSREVLMDVLMKRLGKSEMSGFIEIISQCKDGHMGQTDLYDHMFQKCRNLGIDPTRDFLDLIAYRDYINVNAAINRWALAEESDELERRVVNAICANSVNQKLIYEGLNNLGMLDGLFSLRIDAKNFEHCRNNVEDFRVRHFLEDITKIDKAFVASDVPKDVWTVDDYRDKMMLFFTTAYDRDKAFIRNIKNNLEYKDAVIIMTGGFHTDNLESLLCQNGYSYVSIIPKFEGSDNSRYFSLLSGGLTDIEKAVRVSTSAIALGSVFTELGVDAGKIYQIFGASGDVKNAFNLSVQVVSSLMKKPYAGCTIKDDKGRVFSLSLVKNGPDAKEINIGNECFYIQREHIAEGFHLGTSVGSDAKLVMVHMDLFSLVDPVEAIHANINIDVLRKKFRNRLTINRFPEAIASNDVICSFNGGLNENALFDFGFPAEYVLTGTAAEVCMYATLMSLMRHSLSNGRDVRIVIPADATNASHKGGAEELANYYAENLRKISPDMFGGVKVIYDGQVKLDMKGSDTSKAKAVIEVVDGVDFIEVKETGDANKIISAQNFFGVIPIPLFLIISGVFGPSNFINIIVSMLAAMIIHEAAHVFFNSGSLADIIHGVKFVPYLKQNGNVDIVRTVLFPRITVETQHSHGPPDAFKIASGIFANLLAAGMTYIFVPHSTPFYSVFISMNLIMGIFNALPLTFLGNDGAILLEKMRSTYLAKKQTVLPEEHLRVNTIGDYFAAVSPKRSFFDARASYDKKWAEFKVKESFEKETFLRDFYDYLREVNASLFFKLMRHGKDDSQEDHDSVDWAVYDLARNMWLNVNDMFPANILHGKAGLAQKEVYDLETNIRRFLMHVQYPDLDYIFKNDISGGNGGIMHAVIPVPAIIAAILVFGFSNMIWVFGATFGALAIHEMAHVYKPGGKFTDILRGIRVFPYLRDDGKIDLKNTLLFPRFGVDSLLSYEISDIRSIIAGPLLNAIIGIVAVVSLQSIPSLSSLHEPVLMFGVINLMVGIFNGIPIKSFMTDGTRALHILKDSLQTEVENKNRLKKHAIQEMLGDFKVRPDPLVISRMIIEDGLTEEDIRQAAEEMPELKEFSRPKMNVTLDELNELIPYMRQIVEGIIKDIPKRNLVFMGRDAENLYDAARIVLSGKGQEDRAILFPGSMDFFHSLEKADSDDIARMLEAYGITRTHLEEGQKYIFIDTGFVGRTVCAFREIFRKAYGDFFMEHRADEIVYINDKVFPMRLVSKISSAIVTGVGQIATLEVEEAHRGKLMSTFSRVLRISQSADATDDRINYLIALNLQILPRYFESYGEIEYRDGRALGVPINRGTIRWDVNRARNGNDSIVNPVAAMIVQYQIVKQMMPNGVNGESDAGDDLTTGEVPELRADRSDREEYGRQMSDLLVEKYRGKSPWHLYKKNRGVPLLVSTEHVTSYKAVVDAVENGILTSGEAIVVNFDYHRDYKNMPMPDSSNWIGALVHNGKISGYKWFGGGAEKLSDFKDIDELVGKEIVISIDVDYFSGMLPEERNIAISEIVEFMSRRGLDIRLVTIAYSPEYCTDSSSPDGYFDPEPIAAEICERLDASLIPDGTKIVPMEYLLWAGVCRNINLEEVEDFGVEVAPDTLFGGKDVPMITDFDRDFQLDQSFTNANIPPEKKNLKIYKYIGEDKILSGNVRLKKGARYVLKKFNAVTYTSDDEKYVREAFIDGQAVELTAMNPGNYNPNLPGMIGLVDLDGTAFGREIGKTGHAIMFEYVDGQNIRMYVEKVLYHMAPAARIARYLGMSHKLIEAYKKTYMDKGFVNGDLDTLGILVEDAADGGNRIVFVDNDTTTHVGDTGELAIYKRAAFKEAYARETRVKQRKKWMCGQEVSANDMCDARDDLYSLFKILYEETHMLILPEEADAESVLPFYDVFKRLLEQYVELLEKGGEITADDIAAFVDVTKNLEIDAQNVAGTNSRDEDSQPDLKNGLSERFFKLFGLKVVFRWITGVIKVSFERMRYFAHVVRMVLIRKSIPKLMDFDRDFKYIEDLKTIPKNNDTQHGILSSGIIDGLNEGSSDLGEPLSGSDFSSLAYISMSEIKSLNGLTAFRNHRVMKFEYVGEDMSLPNGIKLEKGREYLVKAWGDEEASRVYLSRQATVLANMNPRNAADLSLPQLVGLVDIDKTEFGKAQSLAGEAMVTEFVEGLALNEYMNYWLMRLPQEEQARLFMRLTSEILNAYNVTFGETGYVNGDLDPTCIVVVGDRDEDVERIVYVDNDSTSNIHDMTMYGEMRKSIRKTEFRSPDRAKRELASDKLSILALCLPRDDEYSLCVTLLRMISLFKRNGKIPADLPGIAKLNVVLEKHRDISDRGKQYTMPELIDEVGRILEENNIKTGQTIDKKAEKKYRLFRLLGSFGGVKRFFNFVLLIGLFCTGICFAGGILDINLSDIVSFESNLTRGDAFFENMSVSHMLIGASLLGKDTSSKDQDDNKASMKMFSWTKTALIIVSFMAVCKLLFVSIPDIKATHVIRWRDIYTLLAVFAAPVYFAGARFIDKIFADVAKAEAKKMSSAQKERLEKEQRSEMETVRTITPLLLAGVSIVGTAAFLLISCPAIVSSHMISLIDLFVVFLMLFAPGYYGGKWVKVKLFGGMKQQKERIGFFAKLLKNIVNRKRAELDFEVAKKKINVLIVSKEFKDAKACLREYKGALDKGQYKELERSIFDSEREDLQREKQDRLRRESEEENRIAMENAQAVKTREEALAKKRQKDALDEEKRRLRMAEQTEKRRQVEEAARQAKKERRQQNAAQKAVTDELMMMTDVLLQGGCEDERQIAECESKIDDAVAILPEETSIILKDRLDKIKSVFAQKHRQTVFEKLASEINEMLASVPIDEDILGACAKKITAAQTVLTEDDIKPIQDRVNAASEKLVVVRMLEAEVVRCLDENTQSGFVEARKAVENAGGILTEDMLRGIKTEIERYENEKLPDVIENEAAALVQNGEISQAIELVRRYERSEDQSGEKTGEITDGSSRNAAFDGLYLAVRKVASKEFNKKVDNIERCIKEGRVTEIEQSLAEMGKFIPLGGVYPGRFEEWKERTEILRSISDTIVRNFSEPVSFIDAVRHYQKEDIEKSRECLEKAGAITISGRAICEAMDQNLDRMGSCMERVEEGEEPSELCEEMTAITELAFLGALGGDAIYRKAQGIILEHRLSELFDEGTKYKEAKDLNAALGTFQRMMEIMGPDAERSAEITVLIEELEFDALVEKDKIENKRRAEFLYEKAVIDFRNGKYSVAAPVFKEAVSLNDEDDAIRKYVRFFALIDELETRVLADPETLTRENVQSAISEAVRIIPTLPLLSPDDRRSAFSFVLKKRTDVLALIEGTNEIEIVSKRKEAEKPSMDHKQLVDVGGNILGILLNESVMVESRTVGVVIRPDKRKVSAQQAEQITEDMFVEIVDALGRRIPVRVNAKRGLTEIKNGGIKYVIYVDDGTSSGENLSRLMDFKEKIAETSKDDKIKPFVWILSEEKRRESQEYQDILSGLKETAYIAGLKGEYLPVSWQMAAGAVFANYIYSRIELRDNDRIKDLEDMVARCAALMTGGMDISGLLKQKEIKELFNGDTLVLILPDALKESGTIEELRKADKKVLRSV